MKELIIDANNENVSIALLENKKLVEYAKDDLQQSYDVGNIYLGKVKKIMSGLNAAFVDKRRSFTITTWARTSRL